MYLKSGDDFFDYDLNFLEDFFTFLDAKLDDLQRRIDESPDPDQLGLFDDGEYLAGLGFVACQRYLSSTFGWKSIEKGEALDTGPKHLRGKTYARILHSAANYWKHADEWDSTAVMTRDITALKRDDELRTIRTIQSVTPWSEYTCFNLLAALTNTEKPRFADLIPILITWRKLLDEKPSNSE
jgi:hypothetical protein